MEENTWTQTELKAAFPGAVTYKDLLAQVSAWIETSGRVVCAVNVNNMNFHEAEELQFEGAPVSEIDFLRILSQSPQELLDESLVECGFHVEKLLKALDESARLFRTEDIHFAHHFHQACIESADQFVQLITHYKTVYQVLRGDLPPSWSQLELAMLGCLTQIIGAYEKKDYILVADLLEYELTNIFSRWKKEFSLIHQGRSGESRPTFDIGS